MTVPVVCVNIDAVDLKEELSLAEFHHLHSFWLVAT
jgi:hypothetical protein